MEQNQINNNQSNNTNLNQQVFQPQYINNANQQPVEQPIIINTCESNKDVLLQTASKTNRTLTILIISTTVLWVLYSVMKWSNTGYFSWTPLLLIVWLILLKRSIKKSANLTERRDTFLYGTVTHRTVYFYNNHLVSYCHETQGRFQINYQAILSITEQKDIYIITLPEKIIIPIHKNGFNLGNAEFFKNFIQSRVSTTTEIKFK